MTHREAMYDPNYLCTDTYFRSFMDEEGFMPLIYLFNYPNVGCIGADYYGVLEALGSHATLEVSTENETVRLRSGWDMVISALVYELIEAVLIWHR